MNSNAIPLCIVDRLVEFAILGSLTDCERISDGLRKFWGTGQWAGVADIEDEENRSLGLQDGDGPCAGTNRALILLTPAFWCGNVGGPWHLGVNQHRIEWRVHPESSDEVEQVRVSRARRKLSCNPERVRPEPSAIRAIRNALVGRQTEYRRYPRINSCSSVREMCHEEVWCAVTSQYTIGCMKQPRIRESPDGREECRPWLGSRYSCMGLLFLSGFHLAIFEVDMADSRRNRGCNRLHSYCVRSCWDIQGWLLEKWNQSNRGKSLGDRLFYFAHRHCYLRSTSR